MTRVAICQSNYIPWKGYFDLIHDVDLFVFYDDVQYTVRDWRNRNLIKTPSGATWLSVPVGADRNRLINEVEIRDHEWQKNHWKTIEQYYKNAGHFGIYKDFFEHVYLARQWSSLSELNQYMVRCIAKDFLGIETNFKNSSDIPRTGAKDAAIRSILASLGATTYVSGPAARSYLDENDLRNNGVELIWKDYSGYPEYFQFFPPFRHDVSVLDLLFHTGPDAYYYIWGWRRENSSDSEVR